MCWEQRIASFGSASCPTVISITLTPLFLMGGYWYVSSSGVEGILVAHFVSSMFAIMLYHARQTIVRRKHVFSVLDLFCRKKEFILCPCIDAIGGRFLFGLLALAL
jgi:hypothetical protein